MIGSGGGGESGRHSTPSLREAILAYALFIFSCGIVHLFAVIVIWDPLYWGEALVKVFTAAAAMFAIVTTARQASKIAETLAAAELAERLATANARLDWFAEELRRLKRNVKRQS